MNRGGHEASVKKQRRDRGRPRGETIERAILACTLDELAAHGLAGLSIERIAERSEVNKTSIYRRWPTKEALIAAAMEGVLVTASATLPGSGDLGADLLVVAKQVAALCKSSQGRALFRAALDAPSDVRARTVGAAATAPAKALVERGKARGSIRRELSAEVLLTTLVGAVMHRVLIERRSPSRVWLLAVVDVLVSGAAPRR